MDSGDVSEKQRAFFDRHPFPGMILAEGCTPSEFARILEKNHLYRMILALLRPGARLADIGCGTGEFTNYLALESRADIVGMDYSEPSLAWAEGIRRRVGAENCRFVFQDVFRMSPEHEGRFDIALAMGLFPSVPRQAEAMAKIAAILKPGGTAIFGFFDPVARSYIRLKRWLVQSISADFEMQKQICDHVLCAHIPSEAEKKWVLNQITEEFLVYHSPRAAAAMMQSCGLEVTDCFPRLSLTDATQASALETGKNGFKLPALQLPVQLNWLFSGTSGYFVLVGRRPPSDGGDGA